jgi:hypothetical protein
VSDDPDSPFDPALPHLAGKRLSEGGGDYSRRLRAAADIRRQRACWMRERGDAAGAAREDHDAAYLERHADRFCDPQEVIGGPLAVGNGGEVVAANDTGVDTFQRIVQQPPDMLAAEATDQRMVQTLGVSNGALTLAVEAAESIGANNALERNLMHQAMAAQTLGLNMLARSSVFLASAISGLPEAKQQMLSIEAARMATTGARLLGTSQGAMLTLERLRNGGRQVVTVQHVTVQDGGQAVVAGSVRRGGRRK